MEKVLRIEDIKTFVKDIAGKHPVRQVKLIGSYANGNPTANSDVDLLVEFEEASICLFDVFGFRHDLEDAMNKKVEIIPLPIPNSSMMSIGREVTLYG